MELLTPSFSIPLLLAIAIISIAGMWKTFEKAGQPGWAYASR